MKPGKAARSRALEITPIDKRYRILYAIQQQDLVIYVVKVGHRKDVYR
jgi:hypothetical protein